MSRRKQENPQPRKRLVSAEAELLQDLLTCGVCQKSFALSDIVKFIQHKIHTCNKENYVLYDEGDFDSDLENDASIQVVGTRRPSISAPISRKNCPGRPDKCGVARPRSLSLVEASAKKEDEELQDGTRRLKMGIGRSLLSCLEGSPEEKPRKEEDAVKCLRPKRLVDADTNTTVTEPSNYVCCTCKQTFTSSWTLVQHAQHLHGLKIYMDSCSTSSTPSSLPPTSNSSQDPVIPQPLSLDTSTHPALQLLRMPLSERQFGPTLNTPNMFPRPASHDFRMELLSDQYHRLNHHPPPLGLSPFEPHHPFDRGPLGLERPRPPPLGIGFEPQMDFYSQRLRQLAGATSPNTAPSPRKLTPPFSQPPLSSSQPSTPTSTPQPVLPSQQPQCPQPPQPSSASSTSSKGGDPPTSPKLKSCEFCGKSFRFQSNLIVHRRSHTGEKPYKCHICNHACTQASKLKRHMKTHQNKSPGGSTVSENNSVESARSTPDSTAKSGCQQCGVDDEGSDGQTADNEEEEEELDEEDELEEEDIEDPGGEMIAEDLSTRAPTNSVPVSSTTSSTEVCQKPEARHSLLGEVMEKIGLNNIQQYNDAYQQALEESSARTMVKLERPLLSEADSNASTVVNNASENGVERPSREEGNKIIGQPPIDFGHGLLGAFDHPFDASKRLKLDLDQPRDRDSLYAGLWLPSVHSSHRDLFMGVNDSDISRHHKSTESALKSVTPTGLGQSLSPRPGTSGNVVSLLHGGGATDHHHHTKPKEQRRNDTCEYCGKVFKNCSNLTVHRRSHTGEKPYKCELCSYACAQSSKLTRHMKTHGRLGKDVYKCRFCDMPFSVPSTLEKHMRKCVVNQNAGIALVDSDSKEVT